MKIHFRSLMNWHLVWCVIKLYFVEFHKFFFRSESYTFPDWFWLNYHRVAINSRYNSILVKKNVEKRKHLLNSQLNWIDIFIVYKLIPPCFVFDELQRQTENNLWHHKNLKYYIPFISQFELQSSEVISFLSHEMYLIIKKLVFGFNCLVYCSIYLKRKKNGYFENEMTFVYMNIERWSV